MCAPCWSFWCFLWSFCSAAPSAFIKWGQVRQPEKNQDSKWKIVWFRQGYSNTFLSYYSIFLPLRIKDSFQGMVTVSPESPYQVLMITQSPVSFENRWIFFLLVSFVFVGKGSSYWPPLGFCWHFSQVHPASFSFSCEDTVCYLQTWISARYFFF